MKYVVKKPIKTKGVIVHPNEEKHVIVDIPEDPVLEDMGYIVPMEVHKSITTEEPEKKPEVPKTTQKPKPSQKKKG